MKKLTTVLLLAFLCLRSSVPVIIRPAPAETKDSTTKPVDSPSVAASWKIGVQMWTFHYVPFVVAIEKADSAGIKYLESFSRSTTRWRHEG